VFAAQVAHVLIVEVREALGGSFVKPAVFTALAVTLFEIAMFAEERLGGTLNMPIVKKP
jgi:hypothetical protein